MKVRIGVGTGRAGDEETLAGLVDDLDVLGFDSIWLPEILTGAALDPFVGLAFAAAHNPRIKLGTTMLLPGRNIVRLAKALSGLDRLSNGRLLVTFVPGLADEPERSAIGVEVAARGAAIDAALPLLRRLLSGEVVDYDGPLGHLESVKVTTGPVQQPLEFWLGGMAEASLRRCGRLGDGWLPSLSSPVEAAAGRAKIDEAARESGRSIDPEHFGVSIAYASGEPDAATLERLRRRARGRPIEELVPHSIKALGEVIGGYIEAGFSKFVVRPLVLEHGWRDELEQLADGVGGLQT